MTRVLSLLAFFSLAASASGASLAISHLAIQQYEDGPPIFKPDGFVAGETVYFNFNAEAAGRKENQVHLSFEAQPKDAAGVPLTPLVSGKLEATLVPEDKDWVPKLRGSFPLPSILLRGEYRIAVHLMDAFSGTSADRDISFLVKGPAVEAATSLTIVNLEFFRNDDAEKPLETAAYRAGEEVHARFLITGYRHRDAGSIDVSYGIKLTGASGQVLFAEPAAARDNSAEFYPKPYVPGSLALTLKPGTAPGEYTLTVTARDAIGDQQAETRRSFRLE